MNARLLAAALLLAPSLAFGQGAVLQGGTTTRFDLPGYIDTRTVQSGSQLFSQQARGFNTSHFFDNKGQGVCTEDALTTGAYHQICLGHDANGNATISVNNLNGAAATPLNFSINGTTYAFPAALSGIAGPGTTAVNDVACWNNTVGSLLKDCGYPARPMIATLAALKALPITAYDTVLRVGNLAIGDMPAALYKAVNAACVEGGGAGDDGGCIRSSDGKAWVLAQQLHYDPRWWGACGDFTCDSTTAIFNAAQWVGLNYPGSVIDFGGRGQRYKIGTTSSPGTPLLPLTRAVKFAHGSLYLAGSLTATTDIIEINPTLADTDGWGYYDMRVFPPTSGIISHSVWRDSIRITDGGDSSKFLRGFEFHDNIFYPSDSRNGGKDLNILATIVGPAGTGLVVQTTFGPNVHSWAGIGGVSIGDSVQFVGWTISTDGNVSASSICWDISNGANGAGELVLQDMNCTQYGGATIRNTYGTHVRGGVFECQGANIASASGALLTIIGGINVDIEATQFQGAGCITPPKVISVDAGARTIRANPILGTNLDPASYTINAAAAPTTDIDKFGNRLNYPFFSARLTTNQGGIASNTLTPVLFDTSIVDPTLAYNNGTGLYTPLIDGWYEISASVCANGTFNGAYQLILRKNAGAATNPAAQTMTNASAGVATYCLTVNGIAFLNGSTDNLSVAALGVLSAGTLTIQGSGNSVVTIKRINHG